jgi:hypothetical protein
MTQFITQFFYEVWGTVNGKFMLLRMCNTYIEANDYANSIKFYSPIIKAIR